MASEQPRYTTGNGDGRQASDYASIPTPSDRPARESLESREHPYSRESIPHQLRGLTQDLTTLFSKEMALARAEVREAVAGIKAGIASMSAGAGLAMAGFLITLMSAVYGLATVLALWLSALIVGVSALVVGFILLKAGQKKMEPAAFKPERALDEIHQDKEAARRMH